LRTFLPNRTGTFIFKVLSVGSTDQCNATTEARSKGGGFTTLKFRKYSCGIAEKLAIACTRPASSLAEHTSVHSILSGPSICETPIALGAVSGRERINRLTLRTANREVGTIKFLTANHLKGINLKRFANVAFVGDCFD
jgi:hypothetical protein